MLSFSIDSGWNSDLNLLYIINFNPENLNPGGGIQKDIQRITFEKAMLSTTFSSLENSIRNWNACCQVLCVDSRWTCDTNLILNQQMTHNFNIAAIFLNIFTWNVWHARCRVAENVCILCFQARNSIVIPCNTRESGWKG